MLRRHFGVALITVVLLGLAAPWALGQEAQTREDDDMWAVWGNDVGWLHVGTMREFRRPRERRTEIWGGISTDPLKKTKLLGPFATKDEAMQALEGAIADLEERYSPRARPNVYLAAKVGGKEYKIGRGIKLKRIPIIRFGPLYLIHITRTYTTGGPVDKDGYVLHAQPPKQGKFWTADGYGGTFTNEGDLVGGPFTTNFELCPVLKGLGLKGISLPGGRWISCEDPGWDEAPEETPSEPAEEPAEEPGEEPADEEAAEDEDAEQRDLDERWLDSMHDAIADAKHKIALAKAQLGIQRIAAAKVRAKIAVLQSAIADGDYSDAQRERMEEKVKELRRQLSEIYKEQDKTIKDAFDTYDRIAQELEAMGSKSKFDDIKKQAAALKKQTERARDMANLELYLGSGQRKKFQALARQYIGRGKYVDAVRVMQSLDYIENKDPRSAVYALRKSLATNPDNRAAQQMLKFLEVGYLKAIDDKTMGEAAMIRAKCWQQLGQHGEPGFWGALKDLFTTGITTSVSAIGGKPQSLADLAATIQDEAAVQHGGLLIITRLREKGLALDKIKGLTNDAFIATAKEFFGQEIAREDALRMRSAMMLAFRNRDVQRLMAQTKEQFDVDRGTSYFNSEAFDATWQDWIGDAVNAKNVLLMLGPSAVVGVGGRTATIGRMTAQELSSATTVKDAFASAIRLPELADKLNKTEVGQACINELLKFEQSTGIVSKVLAEALVQQGVIQTGKAIGGPAGELAAEVLTALGVGDIDLAVKILRNNNVQREAVEAIAKRLRKAVQEADAIHAPAKRYLSQVDEAMQEMAEGEGLSEARKKALRQSSEEAQQQLNTLMVMQASEHQARRVLQQEAEKLRMVREALESAAEGNAGKAKLGRQIVQQMDDKADDAIRQLKKQDEVCRELTSKTKQADQVAQASQADMRLTRPSKPGKTKPMQDVIEDSGLESSSVYRGPQTADGIKKEAEQLQKLDYRKGGVTSAADDAMRRGDYDEAVRRYKQLRAGGNLDDQAAEEVAEKLRVARQTKEAAERFKAAEGPANARVMRDFGEEELEAISGTPPHRLKPLKTSAGEDSLTKPLLVLDESGRPIGVFKQSLPGQRPNSLDVKGEMIASRLAKRLDINTPASAPVTITVDGQKRAGVIVRYIEDGSDLTVVDAGTQRLIKKQVAQDRAMSALLGDHDRHAGNYFVTKTGDVYNIDHGWSDVAERSDIVNWSGSPDEVEKQIATAMEYRARMPGAGDPIIRGIDSQITLEDMLPTIEKIERMGPSDFKALVEGVLDDSETQRAVQTLMLRKKNLRRVLEKHFPPLKAPAVIPLGLAPRQRWVGLWPRWEPQQAPALQLAA